MGRNQIRTKRAGQKAGLKAGQKIANFRTSIASKVIDIKKSKCVSRFERKILTSFL